MTWGSKKDILYALDFNKINPIISNSSLIFYND
jgi:hypothetical protein